MLGSGLAVLAWIGRYGTQGFALSIFMGLALPQFAEAARPLLPITIFMFVAMTFARADWGALRAALMRPRALIIATLWMLAAPVVLIGAVLLIVPREALDPGLLLALVLMGVAPPIMSGPAIAMMLNIEPTVLLAATIIATAAAPFFAPPAAELLLGGPVPLDRGILMVRLLGLIGGAMVLAVGLRWLVGHARLVRHKASLDGFGVVLYFLFAIAAMDGVTRAAVERPGLVSLFLAIAFGLVAAGFLMAWVGLKGLQTPANRFLLGYGTGQRNMGVLVAALGAATPETTFLFFALAQFPIYLMPLFIKPLSARFAVS